MATRVHVTKVSHIPAITAEARLRARSAVIKTVADIKAHAKDIVPVDTGNLKSSIYGRTEKALAGEVFTGVEYAEHVEYGTVKTEAQPFMTPAAEAVRPMFTAAMKQIVDD